MYKNVTDIQCQAFADDFYLKLNMSTEERSMQVRESTDHEIISNYFTYLML